MAFNGKLVNHGTFHGLGDKLTSAAGMIGHATTIYNTVKMIAPYVVRIGSALL